MPIVLITEALLERSTVSDGRTFRDRMLSGFCVRMNARKRTFRIATSVAGKQFRMTLGYWPLMSVEEARGQAMKVLVAKLDRLARNVHFSSGLMQSGVKFVVVDLPEANDLTTHVIAAFAEHEAKRIGERTREALKAAKVRGVVLACCSI